MRANLLMTSLRVHTWCCVILLAILFLLPDQQMMRTRLHARPKAARRSSLAFGCMPLFWNTPSTSRLTGTPAIEDFGASALGALFGGLLLPCCGGSVCGAPLRVTAPHAIRATGDRVARHVCVSPLPIGWRLWLWTATASMMRKLTSHLIRICGGFCTRVQPPAGAAYRTVEAGAQANAQSERIRPWLVVNRFQAISQASITSARLINTELASQPLSRRAKRHNSAAPGSLRKSIPTSSLTLTLPYLGITGSDYCRDAVNRTSTSRFPRTLDGATAHSVYSRGMAGEGDESGSWDGPDDRSAATSRSADCGAAAPASHARTAARNASSWFRVAA